MSGKKRHLLVKPARTGASSRAGFAVVSVLLVLLVLPVVASAQAPAPEPVLPPAVQEDAAVSDSLYIRRAEEAVDYLATYDARNAAVRFGKLREMMTEPGRSEFEQNVIQGELPSIEELRRAQKFVIDDKRTALERFPELGDVVVRLTGKRQQWIGLKPLPADELTFHVNLAEPPTGQGVSADAIAVKDIKVRPAGENFSFPGHISNKLKWMGEYEEKEQRLTRELEQHQEVVTGSLGETAARVERLAKELQETRRALMALEGVVGRQQRQLERQQRELDRLRERRASD